MECKWCVRSGVWEVYKQFEVLTLSYYASMLYATIASYLANKGFLYYPRYMHTVVYKKQPS
jgi:hypothetical protein